MPMTSPYSPASPVVDQPRQQPSAPSATLSAEDEKTYSNNTLLTQTSSQKEVIHADQTVPSIDHKPCVQQAFPNILATSYSPFTSSPNYDFSSKRVLPSYTSSYLRSGSRFVGRQTSDKSTYEVNVELKHVNMAESFLCGYLRIKGLTEDHPTLTTYFEGEMIGDRYSFLTRRPEWGSDEKNDMQHWQRFPAFRPLIPKLKKFDFGYENFTQKESIFMRWKEYFLVPDHRVRQISGASFEGFYYISFNQATGLIEGIYFHAKSEKFQKLLLNHVPDRTFSCMEFR